MIRLLGKFLLLMGCAFCLSAWSEVNYDREFPECIRIDEQVSKMIFTLSGQHQITIPLRQVGKLMVIEAKITDLSHIENKRGIKILGLIGIDLLKDFGMIFDFSGRQLELHCLDDDGFPVSGSFRDKLVDKSNKIVLANHVLLVSGMISGKKLDFALDTGAEMSILSSGLAEKHKESITISQTTRLNGVANHSVEVLYGAIKKKQNKHN